MVNFLCQIQSFTLKNIPLYDLLPLFPYYMFYATLFLAWKDQTQHSPFSLINIDIGLESLLAVYSVWTLKEAWQEQETASVNDRECPFMSLTALSLSHLSPPPCYRAHLSSKVSLFPPSSSPGFSLSSLCVVLALVLVPGICDSVITSDFGGRQQRLSTARCSQGVQLVKAVQSKCRWKYLKGINFLHVQSAIQGFVFSSLLVTLILVATHWCIWLMVTILMKRTRKEKPQSLSKCALSSLKLCHFVVCLVVFMLPRRTNVPHSPCYSSDLLAKTAHYYLYIVRLIIFKPKWKKRRTINKLYSKSS